MEVPEIFVIFEVFSFHLSIIQFQMFYLNNFALLIYKIERNYNFNSLDTLNNIVWNIWLPESDLIFLASSQDIL